MTSAANNTSASQQSPDDIERGSSSPTTDHEKPSTPGEKGNQGPCTPPKNGSESALKALGWLDRLLALWIFLAMAIGIILGNFVDDVGPALKKGKFVGVSIPIAIGLLVMMYPILCKVRYESLHEMFRHRQIWKQMAFSIFVNWIVAPFLMVCSAH